MATKKAKAKLSLVRSTPVPLPANSPSRNLGEHGLALWNSIVADFDMSDAAGREMLTSACQALDRAEACRAIIDDEGELLTNGAGIPKDNPLCKIELANRAFVVRTLGRLGLDVQPVGKIGRPPTFPAAREAT